MKDSLEIFHLDCSSVTPSYVVKIEGERSYVISEKLRKILLLLDGKRSTREVAHIMSSEKCPAISYKQIQQIISDFLWKNGLIEQVDSSDLPNKPALSPEKKNRSFHFTLKVPLISPRMAAKVAKKLTWFFDPFVVIMGLIAVCSAHLAVYLEWFLPRPNAPLEPSQLFVIFLMVVVTVLFHELGHATACHAYGTNHGAIGFCLYLIFPAFYVDLSNTWRLRCRQRAIIDVAGMYFQLLVTVPLFCLYVLTGTPYYAHVIYAIDLMVLLSLNPIFKFDGYWLLVDLSGIVNLHKKVTRVVKEIVLSSLGIAKEMPTLQDVDGKGRKFFIVIYSLITCSVFGAFLLFLCTIAPTQLLLLPENFYQVILGMREESPGITLRLGKLIRNLIFILFIYRLISVVCSSLSKRWNKPKVV